MSEDTFGLECVRTLHRTSLDGFGAPGVDAFWCEWNHPLEAKGRTLEGLLRIHTDEWRWQRFIKPGDTCIDVGAHSGDTAIPMAVCAFSAEQGIRGTVVAVEPNPHVLPVLKINLALNSSLAHFRIAERAVTEVSGVEVEITDHGNSDCNGGIISDQFSEDLQRHLLEIGGSTFRARGDRLEDICRDMLTAEELTRLAFIKTDCEGFDKEILRSSKSFLATHRPVVFVEWFLLFQASDSHDLFAAISEIGYIALNPHTLQRAEVSHHISDLLLIPEERAGEFK